MPTELLETFLRAISPDLKFCVLPGVRLPPGGVRIYLPTLQLLLNIETLECKSCTLQDVLGILAGQKETPPTD